MTRLLVFCGLLTFAVTGCGRPETTEIPEAEGLSNEAYKENALKNIPGGGGEGIGQTN